MVTILMLWLVLVAALRWLPTNHSPVYRHHAEDTVRLIASSSSSTSISDGIYRCLAAWNGILGLRHGEGWGDRGYTSCWARATRSESISFIFNFFPAFLSWPGSPPSRTGGFFYSFPPVFFAIRALCYSHLRARVYVGWQCCSSFLLSFPFEPQHCSEARLVA